MSEEFAISLLNVSKNYKIYNTKLFGVVDALGMGSLLPKHSSTIFWALQDINLKLPKGKRVGIIGRNGAGKSTLLKLISGYLTPTDGIVKVNGKVQSLMDGGAGFHPEFTGYENILASLTYQGLAGNKLQDAIKEIEDFTELGDFLYRPFKTYSLGMQARLTFATATAKKPDILIVDEVLGAGDAYFQQKSAERIKRVVEDSGASVLIVSHALDQVMRYCDHCIWLEMGKIIQFGLSRDVITSYEAFIRNFTEEKLIAHNLKIKQQKSLNVVDTSDFSSDSGAKGKRQLVKWNSNGKLKIVDFRLTNSCNQDTYVFKHGDNLFVKMEISSQESRKYNLVLSTTLHRIDGIGVCNFINEPIDIMFEVGESKIFTMKLPNIMLNDGDYIFSASIFDEYVTEETRCDLISRAYEFNIYGSDKMTNGFMITHPSTWV